MTFPSQTLIDAPTLKALIDARRSPVIVEASFDLADAEAGEREWRAGHLPGSYYLHLERDLSGAKTGRNGRHPLPERTAFAATLGRIGVSPSTPVVLLDRQGGPYAARAWWMLRWIGHADAAVLNGGVAAWLAAGGGLTSSLPGEAVSAPYPLRDALAQAITGDSLQQQLGVARLIDARAPERFRGEVEPLDAAAGHIPGALNRFFKHNLGSDGRFKPADVLHAEFSSLLGSGAASTTVHQCGSGVTACHNLLAMEHAGLTGSRLYPGSWSEWSSDPARPLARG